MTPPTTLYGIQIDSNVPIPMRDGTVLRADIYRPDTEGQWPVILYRFVMDATGIDEFAEMGAYFSRRGYVFIYNDVRGCGRSDGEFFPMVDEAWGKNRDGYDTIEWAACQPWSNGDVGLIGNSYGAFNQYTTAVTRPPSLKACIPFYGSNIKETVFPGGIYRLEDHRGWAMWMAMNCLENQVAPQDRERVRARRGAWADPDSWVWQLPVTECPQLEGVSAWHFEHLTHPTDLDWWSQTDAKTRLDEIDVPMLHIAGWYDLYLSGTLAHYTGLVERGRSEHCRHSQRLIVGPWTHGGCNEPLLPELLDFGPAALADFKGIALRWFDRWLKDSGEDLTEGVADEAAVQLFVMGENRWLEMEQWPPVDVAYTPVYLRQGTGRTEASLNNGHLTFEAPNTAEQPDSFAYDPADPVIGHHGSSPTIELDQREREGQLLTYTSEVLAEPLTVIGPVRALIYASTSACDTDWIVRLCDVDPSGRSTRICDGIVRARYRDSLVEETLLEPGKVYRYEIDMTATGLTFLAGHRMRIHVTSSDFPRYDRNLNTGGSFGAETVFQVAVNKIYHDTKRASHVVLPILREMLDSERAWY